MSEQRQKLTMVMGMVDNLTAPIAKMTDQTKKSGDSIQKTQQKITALNKAAGDIDHFEKLQSSSKKTSQELEQARIKAQMMTRELSAMTAPTKKQTAAVEKQWKEVSKLEDAHQKESAQLEKLRADLYKAGVSTKNLSQGTKRVQDETHRYTQKLKQERAALDQVAKTQQKVNALKSKNRDLGISAAGDTAKITAAGLAMKGMVSSYGEVASAQGELQSLGVGAEGIDKVTKAARDFSQQWSGTTQEQFITASYDIKSGIASLSDEAVGQFTKIAALTAGATKASTGQMTALMASGYNIYRDQFNQFAQDNIKGWESMSASERDIRFGEYFSAGIAASVQAFQTDGAKLSEAIKSLGAAATSSNVPLSEQLSVLGQLQMTMGGSEAATKYKAFLRSATSANDKLGMSFIDANDQLRSMPEILEQLRDRYGETLSDIEKAKLKDAFGTDEAVDMITLLYPKLDQLKGNMTNIHQALNGGLALTMKMAGAILNGPNESLTLFEQRLSGLVIVLGKAIAPAVQFVAETFGTLLVWITNLLEAFPMLRGVIGTVIVSLTALKAAILVTKLSQITLNFSMIKNIQLTGTMGVVQHALAMKTKVLAASQWALNAALTANPIGLIVAGVAALVAVVAVVIKYWEPLSGFFSGLWENLKTTFSIGWEFIKSIFMFSPLGWVIQAWQPLTDFFDGIWQSITGMFSDGLQYITGMLSQVSDWWSGLFGGDEQTEKTLKVTQEMTKNTAAIPSVTNPNAITVRSTALSDGSNEKYQDARSNPPTSIGQVAAKSSSRTFIDKSSVTYEIHASPGMSARDIADEVDRRFAERERMAERKLRTFVLDS